MGQMRGVLLGCGALAEQYSAPAIQAVGLDIVGLVDPSDERTSVLARIFQTAKKSSSITQLTDLASNFCLITSPSRFHAIQSIDSMEAGMHVLCEKPMANTVAEAEQMIATSERTGKVLAIGLFRRFFPSTRAIKEIVQNNSLGKPIRYEFAEGGLFNWPAASPTFFSREHSGGGVLHDLGVHVLDLVAHWFGDPTSVAYEDDAAGGLETNALVHLNHGDFTGEVRLSRDWTTSNRYFIEFEKGWVGWRVGEANRIEMGFNGSSQSFNIQVCGSAENWGNPSPGDAGLTYHQAFTEQLAHFVRAIRGEEPLLVPGSEGIRSLRIIEECYKNRRAMAAI